jgi:ribosomal protein S18 acetylase RimI-like enzyme
MTVTYRDATPADAAALDGLFNSVFCDTFAHLYRPDDLSAFLSSVGISDWEEHFRDPSFAIRIAESDGVPVGYVKIGPMKIPVETGDPSSMLLDQLYVRAEHHGSGIARELMDWAIDEARRRGANALYLTVFIENERAKRFYDRYGFEDVGRYAFMVGEQADEDMILRKPL